CLTALALARLWASDGKPRSMLVRLLPLFPSERKLRLYAVAAARFQLCRYPDVLRWLTVAERYADGLAGDEELGAAQSQAWEAHAPASRVGDSSSDRKAATEPYWVAFKCLYPDAREAALEGRVDAGLEHIAHNPLVGDAGFLLQAGRLREVFGNPFVPPTFD